jgi:hypothetical protein
MRPAILIAAALALAGCSSQRVQPIGFHQYMVTAKGEQAYAEATETCEKMGRKWTPLSIPPGSPAAEFSFECVNSYEIVPAGKDTDRIRVFTPDIPLKHITIPASKENPADLVWVPDLEPADKEAKERATGYCAQQNQGMKVVDHAFDAGAGLNITFMCVPRASGAP